MYNGQQTLAARQQASDAAAQAAGLSGYFEGQATLARQTMENQTGLGLLNLQASLHSDPFRQLSTMYSANGMDGIQRAVNGLSGQYGLPGVFQAPGAAGNTANVGGAISSFNNAGQTMQQAQGILGSFPKANQIIARSYNNAPQNVQDFTTSALSANNGLDQSSNNKLIQNTLPKFQAPAFGLASV